LNRLVISWWLSNSAFFAISIVGEKKNKMKMKNKEEKLIAYCGLYCGECFVHKGIIADLARDLRKELRQTRFDIMATALSEVPFFKVFKDYQTCYEVLGGMVKFRCKRTCRENGGNPDCKIRKCCRKKNLSGCWECDDYRKCNTLDSLDETHGDAHKKNLNILVTFKSVRMGTI